MHAQEEVGCACFTYIVVGFTMAGLYCYYVASMKENEYNYILFFTLDDHARIRLTNSGDDDYINASPIVSISYEV